MIRDLGTAWRFVPDHRPKPFDKAVAVRGLAFGSLDFVLGVDAEGEFESLAFARGALVVAAGAPGLQGLVDGVTLETRDTDVVADDADRARRLGFSGKPCNHPAQDPAVNTVFAPQEQIAWAEHLLAHAPREANGRPTDDQFNLDSRIIDKPLARRIVARAGRTGHGEASQCIR